MNTSSVEIKRWLDFREGFLEKMPSQLGFGVWEEVKGEGPEGCFTGCI
jgi:hypothetical protein